MTDPDLLSLLSKGGIVVALLGLIYLVGMRLVRAIDRLGDKSDALGKKFDEHTDKDMEHHAMVREDLSALSTRLDTALDLTPIRGTRRTSPEGVPVGRYGPMRPKTEPR